MAHQKSDLVHMTQKHDTLGLAAPDSVQRSHGVFVNFVGKIENLFLDQVTDAFLVPRDTGGFTKTLEKIDVFHVYLVRLAR